MGEKSGAVLPPDFSERGRKAWEQYQREHDVAHLRGQVAAIDPETARVWFGEDALDAVDNMRSDGVDTHVWLVRVGFDYLNVKGRR